MNIFQRTALRLTGLDVKHVAHLIPIHADGQPIWSGTNFRELATFGFSKNELIFACIQASALTASTVSLKVHRANDDAPVEDHPLARLIRNPNPFMTEFDLWAALIIYLKLAGRAYFEKERSEGGKVVALWPLRPDWVHPIASSEKGIGGYQFAPPGVPPVVLPAEDVLDFKLWDPLNMIMGHSPTAVAARVGDVDNAVTDFIKLFIEKGGIPPGIIKTTQSLTDADVADIRERWAERYGGWKKWTVPAVLDKDAEYKRTGLTFDEMGFDTLDARNEVRICMVLQVPPIIVGAKIGLERSTYANYGEARKAWWEDFLTPQYKLIMNEIQNDLVSEFDEALTVKWDFSEVPAFQEDANLRWTRATTAFQAGAITRNEFYAEIGGEDRGPRGETYMIPFSSVEVPAGVLAQPNSDDEPKLLPLDPDATYPGEAMKFAENAPDNDDRRIEEAKFRRALRKYFKELNVRVSKTVEEEISIR